MHQQSKRQWVGWALRRKARRPGPVPTGEDEAHSFLLSMSLPSAMLLPCFKLSLSHIGTSWPPLTIPIPIHSLQSYLTIFPTMT